MLTVFRQANRLIAPLYQPMFVSAADIPLLELKAEDTLVFVDDFSGTGDQVLAYWPQTQELIGAEPRTFLILAAATTRAVERIQAQTPLVVLTGKVLGDDSNVFSAASATFRQADRTRLLAHCTLADRRAPRGYGDCGLLFAFGHTTPSNSLPILHASKRAWRGLLPRML